MRRFFNSPNLKTARDSLLETPLKEYQIRSLKHISTAIHKNERGYLDDGGIHYLKVGLSALECIQSALICCGTQPPESILDLPSGYGRVARFLKTAFSEASLHCVELEPAALRFCKREFNATTWLSKKDFSALNLHQKYDLIWCGSLVTHLSRSQCEKLLRCMYRHLSPNGICVFSTHGPQVAEILTQKKLNYSLTPAITAALLNQYRETGYAFTEYEPPRDGYGFSLSNDDQIRQICCRSGDWEIRQFTPAGWDNHQDIYVCQK